MRHIEEQTKLVGEGLGYLAPELIRIYIPVAASDPWQLHPSTANSLTVSTLVTPQSLYYSRGDFTNNHHITSSKCYHIWVPVRDMDLLRSCVIRVATNRSGRLGLSTWWTVYYV